MSAIDENPVPGHWYLCVFYDYQRMEGMISIMKSNVKVLSGIAIFFKRGDNRNRLSEVISESRILLENQMITMLKDRIASIPDL